MMQEPIIRVEQLTASYQDTPVLKDVSFAIHPGEVFVILGGSGSGKSTLMKHMIGLLTPDSGRVFIDGVDIVSADDRQRRRTLDKIGVMFQSGALFGSMTVLDNVRLPLEEFSGLPRHAADLVALMKLDLVGLRDAAHRMPAELSGGMQKRAAIARAMVLDPKILFLDEPSAGLDPITSADLDQLILDLSEHLNMTFVIVTHELPSVYTVASRVILLAKDARSIVAEGTPRELQNDPANPWAWQFFNRQTQTSQRPERRAANGSNGKSPASAGEQMDVRE